MSTSPLIDLGAGVSVPQLGSGVFQVPPADTKAQVVLAWHLAIGNVVIPRT